MDLLETAVAPDLTAVHGLLRLQDERSHHNFPGRTRITIAFFQPLPS